MRIADGFVNILNAPTHYFRVLLQALREQSAAPLPHAAEYTLPGTVPSPVKRWYMEEPALERLFDPVPTTYEANGQGVFYSSFLTVATSSARTFTVLPEMSSNS